MTIKRPSNLDMGAQPLHLHLLDEFLLLLVSSNKTSQKTWSKFWRVTLNTDTVKDASCHCVSTVAHLQTEDSE